MIDKKGQALIEFVLILPVLIMLIFAVIDFGRIFVAKNQLESLSTNVAEYFKDNGQDNINNYLNDITDVKTDLTITKKDDKYTSIKLERTVALMTPGINLILGNDYKASAERVIINE